MQELEKHLYEYLMLFCGLIAFIVSLYFFRQDRGALLVVSLVGSTFYFLWGIIHHKLEGRLSKTLVFEYLVFASLVFLLLATAVNL